MNPIYLDYNATTPIDPSVGEAMRPYLNQYFGNPSSSHAYGLETRQAVEKSRRQVAKLIGCRPDEVVFTSGGSESNNFAIKGVAYARRSRGNHIITSQVEHPAVLEVCRFLEKNGFEVTYLPVDETGMVSPHDVEKSIRPQTILISIMTANNEVGTIQPIGEIGGIARSRDILLHTDAAQAVGKIPVKVDDLQVDMLSIAGHKFYGPKGIGVLYIRSGVVLEKLIHGADHERGWRAGTENILEIVGLGKACELVSERLSSDMTHCLVLRDRLQAGLTRALSGWKINGHPEKRLPNTLSISFQGVEANTLLAELEGVAASAGAACHTDRVDVSSVLEAMGVPLDTAMGTVRFSTGRMTTESDIDRAIELVVPAVKRLQPGTKDGPPVAEGDDRETVRLTRFTHGLGCACKIQPGMLADILKKLPIPDDPRVLVGTDTTDDAAVFRLNDDTALVATVDFFTPVVDDPRVFGSIAAANALSDIYAMGATPLFGLNIVGFPVERLPMSVLEEILDGARLVTDAAGIFVLGGHSIDDTEPKFGMAVIGTVHPDHILTNSGARPGDCLVLTKPLGAGIMTTALKRGLLEADDITQISDLMMALNRIAADMMKAFSIHACTDVTGFGLLGHLVEMTTASGVDVTLAAESIPLLPAAWDLAMQDVVPGGARNNLSHVSSHITWSSGISQTGKLILCDPQTSGGLLIALPESEAHIFVERLEKAGLSGVGLIGRVESAGAGRVTVSGNL